MTLSQFIEVWLKEYADNPDKLSPTTRRKYLDILDSRILPLFGHRKLDEVKTIELVSFLNSLEKPGARLDGKEGLLARGTIDNVYKTLNNIYERACEWKLKSYGKR